MRVLKVLVACEFSGIVRDAFMRRGHDAASCDLLPSEKPGIHYQRFIEDILPQCQWDLLIGHPPCTYLALSGVRWLFGGKGTVKDQKRWREMEKASEFFMLLWNSPVKRIVIENPIPHKHAQLPRYTQIIQPWQHGHPETKATCLWLKNLPPLKPSNIVEGRKPRVHFASPGPDRWKERSRTLQGIAEAMADQWG